MSEQDVLIQAMVEQASQEISVRPENDWYVAETFIGSDRIEHSSYNRASAVQSVRTELGYRFRNALGYLLSGGIDVPRLVIESMGKAVPRV